MIYYRVKPEHDNKHITTGNGRFLSLIGNELLTRTQIYSYSLTHDIMTHYCDVVNINRNNTYYCFGARFENGTTYPHTK